MMQNGNQQIIFCRIYIPCWQSILSKCKPNQPIPTNQVSKEPHTAQNPKCKHWSDGENMQIKLKDMKEILIGLIIREFASNEILGGPFHQWAQLSNL